MMTNNIDFKPIPKQDYFLNGQKYTGEVSFINGFNGHDKTENDSVMCAIVNRSCWTNSVPNILTDVKGHKYHSENRRSQSYNI